MLSLAMLALTAAVMALTLRPKNAEIALLLTLACSVAILFAVLGSAASVADTVRQIVAAAQINADYLAVLLRVIGICLLTEFTANTCRDAGSQSLAGTVTLAGKIMVTISALPLYADILNAVTGMLSG